MTTLVKFISVYVLAAIIYLISWDAYFTILSFLTVSFHWLIVSIFIQEHSLKNSRNILFFYSLILCLISFMSYQQSVILGEELSPYLSGSDGEGYFDQALRLTGGDKFDRLGFLGGAYFGYQLILSFVFDIFGKNLYVGLLFNNTILILTVLLVVRVTWILTRDNQNCFYSALAFILTSKFIFYSNSLLKDPLLIFGVALVSYMIALINSRGAMTLPSYLALILAGLIFGMMRQPMLVIIPISFLLLGLKNLKAIWLPGIIFLFIGTSFFTFIASFTNKIFSAEEIVSIVVNNELLSNAADDGANIDGIVGRVSSVYSQFPILFRIFLLPIPVALQFILPFNFWSTNFFDDHFINFFNTNLNVIWYLFIGVFMIYGAIFWKRLPKNMSSRLFMLGFIAYIAQAFVFGGVVPRYGSPYLVMMFPTIGFLMSCLINKKGHYNHIRKFFQGYYFLVLIAVILFLFISIYRNA